MVLGVKGQTSTGEDRGVNSEPILLREITFPGRAAVMFHAPLTGTK